MNEIVVVLGAAAEEIRPLVGDAEGTKVVVNEAYAEGMARSLQCGLKALDESGKPCWFCWPICRW